MGTACSTYGRRSCIQDFWGGYLLGVDGGVILKWVFKKWDGEAWPVVVAAQDRDR